MGALTLTRVTLAMSKLSLLRLRKKWSEAKTKRLRRLRSLASTGDRLQGGVSRLYALDAVRFHVYASVDDVHSRQLLCTHMPWYETLIAGRLHVLQMPQLRLCSCFTGVALKNRRSMRSQYFWTRKHCILTITLLARSTIQARDNPARNTYKLHIQTNG